MIGVRSGLAKQLKEKNPTMVNTHCVIHSFAPKLRQTLDSAPKVVNYIRSSALNSRLFTLLFEDLEHDKKLFCSIQKYPGSPRATCWLAFTS
nr:unnamed protein product [Callosobruchus analis]